VGVCNALLVAGLTLAAGHAGADAPSDAQIAHIVVTANQVDIDAGNLARSKSKSRQVKEFAERMIGDHKGMNKSALDVAKKLQIKPEPNATSASFKEYADKNMKKLKGLSGSGFDKAYIDNEVVYHQNVLDAVDRTLIPGARNEDLRALLASVRPALVAHLDHAKRLQDATK